MVKVHCQGLRDSHFISEIVLDVMICQCFGCCLVPMEEESRALQNTTVCCRHRAAQRSLYRCEGILFLGADGVS